jgi:hypothetical protein
VQSALVVGRKLLACERLDKLLEPSALTGVWDVAELKAEPPRVRLLEMLHDLPQRKLGFGRVGHGEDAGGVKNLVQGKAVAVQVQLVAATAQRGEGEKKRKRKKIEKMKIRKKAS